MADAEADKLQTLNLEEIGEKKHAKDTYPRRNPEKDAAADAGDNDIPQRKKKYNKL